MRLRLLPHLIPLALSCSCVPVPAFAAADFPVSALRLKGDADAEGHNILNLPAADFAASNGLATASALASETAARQGADTALDARIAAESFAWQGAVAAAVSNLYAAIAAVPDSREYSALHARCDALAAACLSLGSRLDEALALADAAHAAIRSDSETRLSGAVEDLSARLFELDAAIRSDAETRLSFAVDALSARIAAVYTQTLSDNVQTEAALRESIGGVANHDIVQDGRLDALASRDDEINARIDALFCAPLWRHHLPDSLTLPTGAVRPEMPLRFAVAADGTTPVEILDLYGLRVATVSAGADGIAVVSVDFSGAPELSPGTVVARRVAYMDEAGAELAAIRAAADAIELPADPTAAELGAAFRDLLLCIRNPVQARAALRSKGAPSR